MSHLSQYLHRKLQVIVIWGRSDAAYIQHGEIGFPSTNGGKKGFLMFDAKCSDGDGDQYMKGLRVACTVGRCFATTQNLKKNILVFVVFVFVV